MSAPDMIVLGRVVGPYGLRGWVKFHPFCDDVAALGDMKQWSLGTNPEGADWKIHALSGLKPHAKGWIVRFAGVEDRTAAEAIDGMYVAAEREWLPEPDADEYYWADLVGLEVVNVQGERLGRVVELISSGAHDVMCVADDAVDRTGSDAVRQRLLPFVAQVVKKVDPANGTILVEWGLDW